MFKSWRIYLVFIALGILLPTLWQWLRPRGGHITISPETTFIETPVGTGGYIDYCTPFNERASAGVTPENNAVVVFWQVIGPWGMPEEVKEAYFQELGIPIPSEETEATLTGWDSESVLGGPAKDTNMQTLIAAYQELCEAEGNSLAGIDVKPSDALIRLRIWAQHSPWTYEQLPFGEEWIKMNEPHIQRLIAGSKRTRYYSPRLEVDVDQPLREFERPSLITFFRMGDSLGLYAMGKLGSGDTKAATSALLAAIRWGRLATRGGSVDESIWGINFERTALQDLALVACSGQMDASELRQLRKEFRQLPPVGSGADMLDQQERLLGLDYITTAAQQGIVRVLQKDEARRRELQIQQQPDLSVDWDSLLRQYNTMTDFQVRILRTDDYDQQTKLLEELYKRFEQIRQQNYQLDGTTQKSSGRSSANQLGFFLYNVKDQLVRSMHLIDAPWVADAKRRMMETVLALCLYRAKYKAYPEQLSDLLPEFWPDAPAEPFVDPYNREATFVYRLEEEGKEFLLYSIGANGIDEKGREHFELINPGDDLPIRSKPEPVEVMTRKRSSD